MATKAEYLAQGKTEQQIQDATVVKNTADMSQKLGQNLAPTSYAVQSPIVPPAPNLSTSITPISQQMTEWAPTTPVQPEVQAQTDFNAPPQAVSTPQAITTPPQVEKTTTITPEWQTVVKKETPGTPTVDFNVWSGREQDILKNLNEGFSNAPDLFQNKDTFKTAYGYATADDTKKKMLDAFFQSKSAQINNTDALFQQIATNQPIYNQDTKRTPAYQKAFSRFSDMNLNAGLTPNELADKLRNGSITLGSQAYTDLQMKNPALVKNAERLNSINTWVGGQKMDSNTILSNVSNSIIKDVPQADIPNLQKMLSTNPQVSDSLAKSKETKTNVDKLQDTLDNMEDDIRAQYKGTGATEGYIQWVISEKSKPIVRQLNTLNRTYSNQLSELQYYTGIVKDDYDTAKEERKTTSDRAYQTQKDERNFVQQQQLATFQNKLSNESKKLDYAYQDSRDVQNYKQDLQKMGITDMLQTKRDKLNFSQQKELASIQNKYQNSRDVQNYNQDMQKLNYSYQNDPDKIAKQIENNSNLSNGSVINITASGTQSNVMVWTKNIIVDSVWATGLENANNELKAAWIPVIAASWFRDQTATIRSMAERFKIPFNANNPSETAQALRTAGHQVANPWQSKHESGMAIDVYADKRLWKVTTQQESILNKNGWFSAGIPGDAGHFEYKGVQNQTLKKIPERDQKRIDSYSDDYTKNPNVQSAFKFSPLLRQYSNIDVKNLSSSQRQGIISDYAKALDPDSVVREGEYATVAKYSSSFGEKTLSEINQFVSWNGTLSDGAAQKVIDAINSRGKNYFEQERNLRDQYIKKINRISGDNRWEQELIFPDYANWWTSNTQKQTQNTNNIDSILNEWNTRNQ